PTRLFEEVSGRHPTTAIEWAIRLKRYTEQPREGSLRMAGRHSNVVQGRHERHIAIVSHQKRSAQAFADCSAVRRCPREPDGGGRPGPEFARSAQNWRARQDLNLRPPA